MKTLIISYSMTGNNATLAKGLAEKLHADHAELQEQKSRNVMTIMLDAAFSRTPKIQALNEDVEKYDKLIFVAPVWLGQIAFPFRAMFKELKGKVKNYSFISLSAGADGINPNLAKELKKRLGTEADQVLNPLITEILPPEPKPNRKELDAYRLKGQEASNLVRLIETELRYA